MTQPTLAYLHTAEKVCASISSVISQAVQKLLHHITYMLRLINSGLNFTVLSKVHQTQQHCPLSSSSQMKDNDFGYITYKMQ